MNKRAMILEPLPGGGRLASTKDRMSKPRRGISPVEVIVVLVVLLLLFLIVLMALPRQRENARMAGCRRNLMQIGIALALYDKSEATLPTVPTLASDRPIGPGPLK